MLTKTEDNLYVTGHRQQGLICTEKKSPVYCINLISNSGKKVSKPWIYYLAW